MLAIYVVSLWFFVAIEIKKPPPYDYFWRTNTNATHKPPTQFRRAKPLQQQYQHKHQPPSAPRRACQYTLCRLRWAHCIMSLLTLLHNKTQGARDSGFQSLICVCAWCWGQPWAHWEARHKVESGDLVGRHLHSKDAAARVIVRIATYFMHWDLCDTRNFFVANSCDACSQHHMPGLKRMQAAAFVVGVCIYGNVGYLSGYIVVYCVVYTLLRVESWGEKREFKIPKCHHAARLLDGMMMIEEDEFGV